MNEDFSAVNTAAVGIVVACYSLASFIAGLLI